jgi:hypothetical protein
MRAGAVLQPTATIFGVSNELSGANTFAKFHLDRYGRLGFTGGRILYVAVEKIHSPYRIAKRYRTGK